MHPPGNPRQASRPARRPGGAMGESPQYLNPLVAGNNRRGVQPTFSFALHGAGPPRQIAHEPRQGDEI